jgi:hypothetical protein
MQRLSKQVSSSVFVEVTGPEQSRSKRRTKEELVKAYEQEVPQRRSSRRTVRAPATDTTDNEPPLVIT